jgi:predicted PurR-regulated permease PerM
MSSPSSSLGSIASNLFQTIQDVLASFVSSISNYAGTIADFLVGGLLTYATVRYGSRVLRALGRWISDIMP